MKRLFVWAIVFCILTGAALAQTDVLFINAGRADATLVMHKGEKGRTSYLIDTGAAFSAPKVLAALRHFGIDRLDGVFLTHSHQDHVGGLEALLQAVSAENIYTASFGEINKQGSIKTQAHVQKLGRQPTVLNRGDRIPLDGQPAFEVLAPFAPMARENDMSLVMKLTGARHTLLLTGDLEFAGEEALLKSGQDVGADVLKVGNHGNPDATSEAFAKAVSPKLAVISTDTAEDHDSANPRVFAALSMAKTLVTENAFLGYLVSLDADVLSAQPLSLAPAPLQADLINKDGRVLLTGSGDLSGAALVSQEKGKVHIFPQGATLQDDLPLVLLGEEGALLDGKFIRKKKGDTLLLYDRHGHLAARLDVRQGQ